MLVIQNLTLSTRQVILQNFSYQFQKGNSYLISATNGSGKTTFFRSLVNLKAVDQGTVTFDQLPFDQHKHQVFYYETSDWLDQNMSGMDYLKLVKKLWHSDLEIDVEINFWKMTDYINLPIKKYSLGMKQRVLIAMYLISDADYLIMDEISNGLDEESRDKLFNRLRALTNQRNKCILLSSHYREETSTAIDHVLELKNETMTEIWQ